MLPHPTVCVPKPPEDACYCKEMQRTCSCLPLGCTCCWALGCSASSCLDNLVLEKRKQAASAAFDPTGHRPNWPSVQLAFGPTGHLFKWLRANWFCTVWLQGNMVGARNLCPVLHDQTSELASSPASTAVRKSLDACIDSLSRFKRLSMNRGDSLLSDLDDDW